MQVQVLPDAPLCKIRRYFTSRSRPKKVRLCHVFATFTSLASWTSHFLTFQAFTFREKKCSNRGGALPALLRLIANMKSHTEAAAASGEELRAYTPEYVAEAISLHVETVRAALRTGRLPGVRVGSHWRITHNTLLSILRSGLPPTR